MILAGQFLPLYIVHHLAGITLAGTAMQVYNNTLLVGGKFGIAFATLRGPLAIGNFSIVPNFKGHYYNHIYTLMVNTAGNIVANTGSITVDSGAQLTAADGGRLLLAAPTVRNSGSLTAPDGQVILAAGQTVYLTASHDPNLRGLVVEVDGVVEPSTAVVAHAAEDGHMLLRVRRRDAVFYAAVRR